MSPTEQPTSCGREFFSASAKWERHVLGHSPGRFSFYEDRIEFIPHARSILNREETKLRRLKEAIRLLASGKELGLK